MLGTKTSIPTSPCQNITKRLGKEELFGTAFEKENNCLETMVKEMRMQIAASNLELKIGS